ncbi:hypothetical protein DEO72_LG5g1545 [Vigna unguiculata]|uniref:Uncharacterized protein n=1 Tax=Vigna unguiculata TaxID=3917 RepID=A0A4D6LY71_VIGUN|nr:hypothetical protein DEO72_LG5g1545 [Vigna unguiculata]
MVAHCLVTVVSNQETNGEEKVADDAGCDSRHECGDKRQPWSDSRWTAMARCCSCVVEAEDDGTNPSICEEVEERFLLFFQPWQAATIVRSGNVMWRYDVGVAVRGTTVMERDAASREMEKVKPLVC